MRMIDSKTEQCNIAVCKQRDLEKFQIYVNVAGADEEPGVLWARKLKIHKNICVCGSGVLFSKIHPHCRQQQQRRDYIDEKIRFKYLI